MNSSVKKVVIVDGLRTPFTKAGKEFRKIHPADLASWNLRELIFRQGLKDLAVDEVIVGNVANSPDSANIARVVALRAGLPERTSAMTVHRNCASSMESVTVGVAKILSGMMDTVVAGGVESMSQVPLMLSSSFQDMLTRFMMSRSFSEKWKALLSFRFHFLKLRYGLLEALTDPFTGIQMGQTAEILAKEFHISREEQDNFAMESHRRALASMEKLKEEVFSVFVDSKYKVIDRDLCPREGLTKEKMSRLRPYFDKKYGTVTVGNSCPINDGSSMLLLMEEEKAKALGFKSLVRVRATSFVGLDPKRMGLGPVYSIPLALKKASLTLKHMGLIEINEAFSAQVLACMQAMSSDRFAKDKLNLSKAVGEVDSSILNVNGGAIAIGHPVSATGGRILLTLAKEMKRRNVEFGLASLCIGGGQGGAVILENIS